MDSHFLEFLGNFLIQTARGQRHLEDMARWIGGGFKGSEDLNALFRRSYGLDTLNKDGPDYLKMQQKASKDLLESFKDYFSAFGLVSREEHLKLVKKYEALKEKTSAQEETIKNLRMLLGEKVTDPENVVSGFQELMKNQTDQFQKMMENFGQLLQKKSS